MSTTSATSWEISEFNSSGKNKSNIWSGLVSLGFSKYGAAAIMGNAMQESRLNTYAYQPLDGKSLQTNINYTNEINQGKHDDVFLSKKYNKAYGLIQWDGVRRLCLYENTSKKGKNIGSLSVQLNHLKLEITDTFQKQYELSSFKNSVWEYLKEGSTKSEANNLDYLTINIFHNKFEGSADDADKLHHRKAWAKLCYDYYLNTPISNVINENQVNTSSNFINILKREASLGIKEQGTNRVKYNNYNGKAWCLYFIQWCLKEAGISAYDTASCTDFRDHYKDTDALISRNNLIPGDIILFTRDKFSGEKTTKCWHVGGVIESPGGGKYITVEGNTGPPSGSQDEGDGVYTKTRTINNSTFPVVCGIRLEGANAIGGDTATVSGSTLSQWAQTAITTFFGNIQNAFSGLSDGFNSIFKIGAAVSTKEIEYKEVNVNVNRDIITSINADANSIRAKGQSLLTAPTLVEAPFVTLQVGDVTLGTVFNNTTNRQYPNYITSIDVVKVNGTVNQYTIQMVYQIEAGQDPNLIDKIFSKVGYGNVYITYGDYNAPAFIYRTEKAIITNLQSNVDFSNSRITYVLSCTSDSLALMGGNYSFPARTESPSTIIYGMLYEKNSTYKLLDIFPGMKNKSLVQSKGLIPRDDASVKIEAKQGMDALSYINYLSTCMSPIGTDSDSALKNANYYFTIHDDYDGTFGGPYFKITKVSANTNDLKVIAYNSPNTYEIDIGYPGDTLVTSFRLNNNNSWALLYNYSNKVNMPVYSYNIDNEGRLIETSSPNILLSSKYNRITETQRDWWTQMTRFPIQATLEIKGLLKPVLLMTYIRINTLFYGQRHSSSGLYIVTKQADRIDDRGYRTTLSLTRVAGDLDTIQTKSQQITTKVVTGYKNTGANPEEEEKQEKIREFFNTTFTNTLNMTYKEYEEKEKKIKENNEKKVKEVNDVINKYGIYIDKQDMTCDVNGILWITATVDKDLKDSTITWASSDTSIATVYNGKVTCLKPGKVNITATNSEGKSATCIVTIQQPADGTVTLDKKEVTCDVDGILWLVATVWGSENNEVTWSSTDESIATVVNGKVTMHTYGTVYITAKASNDKSDWCKIIVRQPWIKLNKSKIIYKETDTTDYWLIPDYAPKNLTITWSSSDTSIVTAYNGHIELAEPFKIGTSTITATLSSGESAKCVVQTEYENPVTKIVLNKTDEHIKVDDEMWITATITPKDATNQDVIWTSSDNSIATVYNGKVIGISAGKVTITATTYNNLSAKCSVDVLNK